MRTRIDLVVPAVAVLTFIIVGIIAAVMAVTIDRESHSCESIVLDAGYEPLPPGPVYVTSVEFDSASGLCVGRIR